MPGGSSGRGCLHPDATLSEAAARFAGIDRLGGVPVLLLVTETAALSPLTAVVGVGVFGVTAGPERLPQAGGGLGVVAVDRQVDGLVDDGPPAGGVRVPL